MPYSRLARNSSHLQQFLKLPSSQLARTLESAATPSLEGSAALLSLQSIVPKRNGVSLIGWAASSCKLQRNWNGESRLPLPARECQLQPFALLNSNLERDTVADGLRSRTSAGRDGHNEGTCRWPARRGRRTGIAAASAQRTQKPRQDQYCAESPCPLFPGPCQKKCTSECRTCE